MSQDLSELTTRIKLPAPPEAAWWREQPSGPAGTGDRRLIAVLRFRPADLAAIEAAGEPAADQEVSLPDDLLLDALPPEFRALVRPDGRGGHRLDGVVRDPEPFIRSPLLNGYFLRAAGSEYVLLELFTT